jgi:CMP-N-acetylneuraminic acid synthetase
MLYWAIQACKESKYIDAVYVSTEDEEVASIAAENHVHLVRRPSALADDYVFKQDVIVHAAETIETPKPDIVVSLQANSPEICANDIDAAIEKLVHFDRSEIFSVDPNLIQNAAFRVMRYEYVFQKSISTRSGVYITNYTDVHTAKDLEFVEMQRRPCEVKAHAS